MRFDLCKTGFIPGFEALSHSVAFPEDIARNFDSAFQMLAAISLHLDEISRSGLRGGADGGTNMVEGGKVGRMKHLRGKRKRLQQFLEESVRRERREEEDKDISWSRKVKKIGLDALFS